MRRATREARTLAISSHAAAVAARAIVSIAPRRVSFTGYPIDVLAGYRAEHLEQEADRYWLRLANTMMGRG